VNEHGHLGPRITVLSVGLALILAACGGRDGTSADRSGAARDATTTASGACPNGGTPERNVPYASVPGVDPNLLSLDIYPPETGCPAPVVVWVHGGGFRIGDKRFQMVDKVRLLNDLRYMVVSVNYRLTDATAAEPVRYPTHAQDVASAIAWIDRNIARYGGDPDQIALMGHSAGAQIVATVATDPQLLGAHGLAPDDLACVAPLDTEGFDVARQVGLGLPIYVDTFGTDPATLTAASPLTHVKTGAGIPPHLLVKRGSIGRQRLVDQYSAALTAAGIPVTVVDARGLTHEDVNVRIGAVGDTVMTPAVTTFLADCFARGT